MKNEPNHPWAFQHIRAKNSRNGNPQRLYMVYSRQGNTLQVINEGYAGINAIARRVGWAFREIRTHLVELTPINVPVSEWRALLKAFPKENTDE